MPGFQRAAAFDFRELPGLQRKEAYDFTMDQPGTNIIKPDRKNSMTLDDALLCRHTKKKTTDIDKINSRFESHQAVDKLYQTKNNETKAIK